MFRTIVYNAYNKNNNYMILRRLIDNLKTNLYTVLNKGDHRSFLNTIITLAVGKSFGYTTALQLYVT